jgi:septal ring factor EnvC (AmiA/AmiB activator)
MNGFFRVVTTCVLLALAAGLAAPAAEGRKDDPSKARQELERVKREMLEKKRELKQASRKEHSVLAELEKIDREIQAGSAELAIQQERLRKAESAYRDTGEKSAGLSQELAGLSKRYGHRLRALYKMHRGGSATILNADGQVRIDRQVKYLAVIAESDRRVIAEFEDALNRLARKHAELAEKKEELSERRRTIAAKKEEQEAKRRRKSTILAGVRKEKGLSEQALKELEEASAGLWTMIKNEERARRLAKRAAVPQTRAVGKGVMPWPLKGPVLMHFGMQRHPELGTMVFRRGIEIEAQEGQQVRAVEGGEAAYADWYKGYGKLVILDHGDGFYTLYGNLSHLSINKGDQVTKGQVIGLAGETGSLKGPKLYFEIRKNGEAQDPLMWLAAR